MRSPTSIREQFDHHESAFVGEVGGLLVKASQLSIRSFNFGQHWRTPGLRNVSYTATLPLTFITHLLTRELPDYIADCINSPDIHPFEVLLRHRHWPDAQQTLEDPELCALALQWFGHDCLLEWLGDGEPAEMPGYVINTIDFAARDGDRVRFNGYARQAGLTVQYQDV